MRTKTKPAPKPAASEVDHDYRKKLADKLALRVGECSAIVPVKDETGAVVGAGPCSCNGWYDPWTDMHGWRICGCSHTGYVHAVMPPSGKPA